MTKAHAKQSGNYAASQQKGETMLGKSLFVKSYVVINQGCPLAITREGPDHVLIRCGGSEGESFEIVTQHEALRALVELGTDALTWVDAEDQHNPPTEDRIQD